VLGILNRAGVVPEVSQIAGEMPTLISLVASGAGMSLLPVSAVKNNRAAVASCKVVDKIPISEIAYLLAEPGSHFEWFPIWKKQSQVEPTISKFIDVLVAELKSP
jgi:DNA-binding transcriptional LysR family regulator